QACRDCHALQGGAHLCGPLRRRPGGRQTRYRDGLHVQDVGVGPAGQGHRRMPAAFWRLWLYERVRDRPHVCGCPYPAHLWRHERDHEGSHFPRTLRNDSMQYETLLFDVEDGIATITLNRPDKLNAFTRRMAEEIIQALDRVDADDEIGAVIFTGAGRAFCAGADVSGGENTFRSEEHTSELQ